MPAAGRLPDDWHSQLATVLQSEPMVELRRFLQTERDAGATIYPPMAQVFNAFQHTNLADVKVVILGQDPYHGAGQAHGLSFSVAPGVPIPRSLQNIYKELQTDLGIAPARHGSLIRWAEQGVLLLNAVLSVRAGEPDSHKGRGWEVFTDAVVDLINQQRQDVVFMLWGKNAQVKGARVDTGKHLVLKSVHPSPLSADRGFFGCKHFSKANEYLQSRGLVGIDWRV
jgi:uracil-DNA glycosylase